MHGFPLRCKVCHNDITKIPNNASWTNLKFRVARLVSNFVKVLNFFDFFKFWISQLCELITLALKLFDWDVFNKKVPIWLKEWREVQIYVITMHSLSFLCICHHLSWWLGCLGPPIVLSSVPIIFPNMHYHPLSSFLVCLVTNIQKNACSFRSLPILEIKFSFHPGMTRDC